SRTIRIQEAHIPHYRSVALSDMLGAANSPAQRPDRYFPAFRSVAPFSIAGVPLGIARGAIDCVLSGMCARSDVRPEDLSMPGRSATCARIAEAAAQVDAAYALVLSDAEHVDALKNEQSFGALDA